MQRVTVPLRKLFPHRRTPRKPPYFIQLLAISHCFGLKLLRSYQTQARNRLTNMDFVGTWHIYEMDLWDEDYFNMEVQAYIEIESNNQGDFQFGLVAGGLHGRVVDDVDVEGKKRFEFTWSGNDECDPASGSGWVRVKSPNILEGEFRIHQGDDSTFLAKRA
jgi:hypothetical protein